MRQSNRKHLQVEALEAKALLSTIHAQAVPGGASHAVVVRQAGSGSTGDALPAGDVQAMQHDASVNNLEVFLAQLAVLESRRADVQQYAATLLTEHRDSGMMLEDLAMQKNVLLPADIQPGEEAVANRVLSAVNTRSFDRVYLTAMVQTHSQLIAQVTQQANSTQDRDLKSFLLGSLPTDQAHLAAARALLANPGTGSSGNAGQGNISVGAGGTTLNARDLQALEQSYSGSQLDLFLSQLATIKDNRPAVQQFGTKLVEDHTQDNRELTTVSNAANVTLPAGVQGMDQVTARQVLASVNTRRFDKVYLSTMVETHTQDIANNKKTIATAQDPNLKEYSQSDLSTDYLHLGGARKLLRGTRHS